MLGFVCGSAVFHFVHALRRLDVQQGNHLAALSHLLLAGRTPFFGGQRLLTISVTVKVSAVRPFMTTTQIWALAI